MMNNELRPYESYIDTGMDWLENIPAHWEKTSIRGITELSNKRCGLRDDLELLSVYREYGVVRKKSRDDNHNVESLDLSNYKYVDKGYLVLNKMKMWQGSLGVSKYEGIVSPAYIVCKIKCDLNLEYLHLLFRSPKYKTIYNRISYGVRVGQWDMRYDDFKKINLFIPPRSEQDKIVKYLDHQLLKISKFVKAKKKIIAALKEQKQAIINEAVTKGLDPNVKMKPSGIEWLGDVPEHWSVCKLKNMGMFKSGSNLTSLQIEETGNYPVYGGNGLRGYYNEYSHYGEYILIGRQGALCGNVHHVEGKFWPTEHAIVVTTRKFVDVLWLKYLLIAMNLNQYSQSAAQPGLAVENITKLRTALPEISEQKQIAHFINEKLVKIEKSMDFVNREIELISEYKTRLISDVVTGKIDVRNIIIEGPEDENIEEDTEFEEDSIDEETLEAEDGDE